jgi:hypothetical protein
MRRVSLLFATFSFSLALVEAAPVHAAPAAGSTGMAEAAAALEPGQFVWRPDRAPEGEVEIVVSVPLQTVYVYRGGTLIGVSTASTGRAGYDTPVGRFAILQKNRDHRSNLYDDAPMPFMQRLTWDGIALHGGDIPGYPASHGCIRLPPRFARHLFAATELGGAVHVVNAAPATAEEALALARGGDSYSGMGGPDPERDGD